MSQFEGTSLVSYLTVKKKKKRIVSYCQPVLEFGSSDSQWGVLFSIKSIFCVVHTFSHNPLNQHPF